MIPLGVVVRDEFADSLVEGFATEEDHLAQALGFDALSRIARRADCSLATGRGS